MSNLQVRQSPSGQDMHVAQRDVALRQNPVGAAVIVAGAAAVAVETQTLVLKAGQGVMVFGQLAGVSAGAGGVLTASISTTVAPAAAVILRANESNIAAAGETSTATVMALFVPVIPNVATTVVVSLMAAAAVQNFDVGSTAGGDGGASLYTVVVDLHDATLTTATP